MRIRLASRLVGGASVPDDGVSVVEVGSELGFVGESGGTRYIADNGYRGVDVV